MCLQRSEFMSGEQIGRTRPQIVKINQYETTVNRHRDHEAMKPRRIKDGKVRRLALISDALLIMRLSSEVSSHTAKRILILLAMTGKICSFYILIY
jgi:hypothetical protein